MFKDNKLRLLMKLVGFTRLGEDHDPDASWIVPSSLTSADLQEAMDLIRKYEFDPPVYEDGKGPEDMLRSKAATERRAAPRVEFDDDSDGESDQDRGEYAADGPTARKPDGTRKILKRRRRERTPVELDDEEKQERAEARRRREMEKQMKVKSTMFVHDSDDEEWDEEKEKQFYDRESEIRKFTMAQFKKSMGLSVAEPTSSKKKRKADEQSKKDRKRRKTPPKRKAGPFDTDDSEDENMVISDGSEADSEEASKGVEEVDTEDEDEVTDTPLSSQQAGVRRTVEDNPPSTMTPAKEQDVVMVDDEDEDEDEDDAPIVRRPAARNIRAGFVIDSDSE